MTVIGRNKKIIVLTVLFVLLAALLVFAVVGLRNIGEDKTAVYRDAGATVKVTFVANGGTINGGGSYYRMVKPGDLVLEPGKELSDGTVTAGAVLTGHTLASWNLGTVHEDGTVELGEAVDFSTFRPTEDTVLYAKWRTYFNFRLVDAATGEERDVKTVQPGEDGQVHFTAVTYRSSVGYTFFEYYEDAEKTIPVDFSKDYANDQNEMTVYCYCLPGEWTRLNSKTTNINLKYNANYYLEEDIDLGGKVLNFNKSGSWMGNYKGKIVGNGHTISNFTLNWQTKLVSAVGLFKELEKGAQITDVTFADVTIIADSTQANTPAFGAIAPKIGEGVVLRGVHFNNLTVRYTENLSIKGLTDPAIGYEIGKDVAIEDCSLDVRFEKLP